MFCLSESISDFVSRAESDKVAGLVGCEGIDCDAKDFDEFMSIPRFQCFECSFVCRK